MRRSSLSIRRWKTPLKLCVTTVICAGLYVVADWRAVLRELVQLDFGYFAAALLLFVPQTIVSAVRWRGLVAGAAEASSAIVVPTLRSAVEQTLASSALNLVVPSKLGDFSKAAFVTTDAAATKARLAKLVVLEKIADLAALFLVAVCCAQSIGPNGMIVGTAVFTIACAAFLVVRLVASRSVHRACGVLLPSTCGLWLLHLLQVHLFVRAAGVEVPWSVTFARAPLALLAGVVPAAFCGIGIRDAAFVRLFADVAPAASMAVVGMLTALRYLVPGIVGLPMLWRLRIETTSVSASPPSATFQQRFAADPADKSTSRRRDVSARESHATS